MAFDGDNQHSLSSFVRRTIKIFASVITRGTKHWLLAGYVQTLATYRMAWISHWLKRSLMEVSWDDMYNAEERHWCLGKNVHSDWVIDVRGDRHNDAGCRQHGRVAFVYECFISRNIVDVLWCLSVIKLLLLLLWFFKSASVKFIGFIWWSQCFFWGEFIPSVQYCGKASEPDFCAVIYCAVVDMFCACLSVKFLWLCV